MKTKAAYREYLKSEHWDNLRSAVIERDGNRCTRCPSTKWLQAHHVIYRVRWEDSVPADLITLCHSCHRKEHGLPKAAQVQHQNRATPPRTGDARRFTRLRHVNKARRMGLIGKAEYRRLKAWFREKQRSKQRHRVHRKKNREVRWWPGMYEGMAPGQLR